MVVIEIDPIWNDELGLGPPSSLKITLKGGWTSVCLVQVVKSPSPIPSWESCWPGKYWATPQLLPFFFFFYTSIVSSWNKEDFWKCLHVPRGLQGVRKWGYTCPSPFQLYSFRFTSSLIVAYPPANDRHTISVSVSCGKDNFSHCC